MAGSDKLYLQPILKDLLDGLNTSMSSIDGIVDGLGEAVAAMKLAVDGVSETLTIVKGSIDTTNQNLQAVNESIIAPDKYLMPSMEGKENYGIGVGSNGTITGTSVFPYAYIGRFRANYNGIVNIMVNAKKSSGGQCDLVLCDLTTNSEIVLISSSTLTITATSYTVLAPLSKDHDYALSVKGSTGSITLASESHGDLGRTPLAAFYVIDYAHLDPLDYIVSGI